MSNKTPPIVSEATASLRERWAAEKRPGETFMQWVKRQPVSYCGGKLKKIFDAQYAAVMRGDDAEAERLDGEIEKFLQRHERIKRGEIAPGTPTKQ